MRAPTSILPLQLDDVSFVAGERAIVDRVSLVLDAGQRLRKQAADVGNLKTTPQQTVETKTENDKIIVEVKPADPMVVYVPQYDPTVIYSTPPPPPPPPPAAAPSTRRHAACLAGSELPRRKVARAAAGRRAHSNRR